MAIIARQVLNSIGADEMCARRTHDDQDGAEWICTLAPRHGGWPHVAHYDHSELGEVIGLIWTDD